MPFLKLLSRPGRWLWMALLTSLCQPWDLSATEHMPSAESIAWTHEQVHQAAELIRQRIETDHWTRGQSGTTCGIYAACRALALLGIDRDPGDYFTTKYVSHAEGSTPNEVISIASQNGAYAWPIVNLSKTDLMLLGSPVIANVKPSQNAQVYDHWVCVTYQDGRLLVFDGPATAVEMSFAEFLSLWNGYGIAVSADDAPMAVTSWVLRATTMAGLALLAALIWQAWPVRYRTAPRDSLIFLGTVTLVLAAAGSVLFGDPIHVFQVREVPGELQHIDLETFCKFITDGQHVVIDARLESTYEAGAVDGAINLPGGTSPVALKGLLIDVDRDLPIVVYCHSESCEYDAVIADKLQSLGFRQIAVANVGWVEYSAAVSQSSGSDL